MATGAPRGAQWGSPCFFFPRPSPAAVCNTRGGGRGRSVAAGMPPGHLWRERSSTSSVHKFRTSGSFSASVGHFCSFDYNSILSEPFSIFVWIFSSCFAFIYFVCNEEFQCRARHVLHGGDNVSQLGKIPSTPSLIVKELCLSFAHSLDAYMLHVCVPHRLSLKQFSRTPSSLAALPQLQPGSLAMYSPRARKELLLCPGLNRRTPLPLPGLTPTSLAWSLVAWAVVKELFFSVPGGGRVR